MEGITRYHLVLCTFAKALPPKIIMHFVSVWMTINMANIVKIIFVDFASFQEKERKKEMLFYLCNISHN